MGALAAGAVLLAACTGGAGSDDPSPATGPIEGPLVDPDEIISGGPPPDGIPPIDEPRFVSPAEADFLFGKEPVLAIEIDGDARAYPARILIWHEIVNDEVGGVPVTVTYCPLCNTGVAFERPTIDGVLLDFGTSGKLYKSNLVMYDRQTDSLWPQVTGVAVMGPLLGTELEQVPVQMVAWDDWAAEHPDGKVLSQDTGHRRSYGTNPYGGYDDPNTNPGFGVSDVDTRLPPKARVLGVRMGEDAIAFPYAAVQDRTLGWGVGRAEVGGEDVVVFWKAGAVSAIDAPLIQDSREVGSMGSFRPRVGGQTLTFRAEGSGIVDEQTGSRWDIFGRAVDGPLTGEELERVTAIESLWFDWAGFFPDTRIYEA
jgi:hypothetical protein